MAAGFTVLFGAPFGSAVFALELLHRRGLQYYEALVPAILASLSGYAVYVCVAAVGLGPCGTSRRRRRSTSATSDGRWSPAPAARWSRSCSRI